MIALHDVAPTTIAEATQWRSTVAASTDGPVSLLVVPRYRGRDSWRSGSHRAWVRGRVEAGDELVLTATRTWIVAATTAASSAGARRPPWRR